MSFCELKVLPRHLAIIMDGNGRWACERGLPRIEGHRKGAESVRKIVTFSRELGIKNLSLFAFSSQNWSRPSFEVDALMSLLSLYVRSERSTILDNDIRLTAIGNIDLLPRSAKNSLFKLISDSSSNTSMNLCLCLSFGGREEIVSCVKDIALRVSTGDLDPSDIDEKLIDSSLWSSSLGPVDLLIRTSGELRISNFFLWEIAYSELYFTDCFWPDFDETSLENALHSYSQRQRRFGKIE